MQSYISSCCEFYCVAVFFCFLRGFFLTLLPFAQQRKFDDAKTAVVFSLMRDVHEKSLGSVLAHLA